MAKEPVSNSEIRNFLNKHLDLLTKEYENSVSIKIESDDFDYERMRKLDLDRIEREIEIIGSISSLIK